MRIAIIGRGTSGIIQALRLIPYQHEIDIYFDPEKPILNVGESSTPHFGDLIYDILGIPMGSLVNDEVVSHKIGVEFINWGRGATFRHYFAGGQLAFQFQTKILNTFLEEKLLEKGVKFVPLRVDTHTVRNGYAYINNTPYDFIIYCTGWGSNEFRPPLLETVNSAVLYKKKHLEKEPVYTLHEATKHGWQFGLPFPALNETRHGYLYNNKINTKEEVVRELKEKRGVDEFKTIEWQPKQSPVMIEDVFHAYNGNRLIFNEPIQALSLLIYDQCAYQIAKFLEQRDVESIAEANSEYMKLITRYYEGVAFHYQFGSSISSPFWIQKQKEAKQFFFRNWQNNIDSLLSFYRHDVKVSLRERTDEFPNKLLTIGPFSFTDFRDLYEGMTQTKIPLHD
jgi:hypothetical protein